jgi:hypothetical protein
VLPLVTDNVTMSADPSFGLQNASARERPSAAKMMKRFVLSK